MAEYVLRFVIGGLVVSCFAILGDMLRPKSFAGLLGAAPSVALATLGITLVSQDAHIAAVQARSMMLGSIALALYSILVCHLLVRTRLRALPATLTAFLLWLAVALGLQQLMLGSV